jgi:hypothetical protein
VNGVVLRGRQRSENVSNTSEVNKMNHGIKEHLKKRRHHVHRMPDLIKQNKNFSCGLRGKQDLGRLTIMFILLPRQFMFLLISTNKFQPLSEISAQIIKHKV